MNHLITHAKLLFVAGAWGGAWTSGRIVATHIPPVLGATLRYAMAVPMFLLILRWLEPSDEGRWGIRPPSRGEWRRLMMIGIFSTFLYQVLFMLGMQRTAAGDASLVISFNPVFTAILAVLFLGERFTARMGAGLGLGVAGVVLIFLRSPNVALDPQDRMIGDGLILLAAMAWATSTILMKRAMDEPTLDAEAPLTPLALTTWASLVGLVLLVPVVGLEALLDDGPTTWVIRGLDWWNILYLALISTVIAYVWFADGVQRIGAERAALYVFLVPPFGVLTGVVFLGEAFGWEMLIAFASIILGVRLASTSSSEPADTALKSGADRNA